METAPPCGASLPWRVLGRSAQALPGAAAAVDEDEGEDEEAGGHAEGPMLRLGAGPGLPLGRFPAARVVAEMAPRLGDLPAAFEVPPSSFFNLIIIIFLFLFFYLHLLNIFHNRLRRVHLIMSHSSHHQLLLHYQKISFLIFSIVNFAIIFHIIFLNFFLIIFIFIVIIVCLNSLRIILLCCLFNSVSSIFIYLLPSLLIRFITVSISVYFFPSLLMLLIFDY
ncbi:hypothetical protein R5R35_003910 [Gryllus longicercus]|uniref:Uncharacterized protein n=1 Tax=Gryllus longicercus TaxID=2509291 RepID=A0AAN9V6C3_9ORTH